MEIAMTTRPHLSLHRWRWGSRPAGAGRWAHLLGIVVLVLIGLLAVLLVEFCPLLEGLLLWAARE